jgi:hypothetical protein
VNISFMLEFDFGFPHDEAVEENSNDCEGNLASACDPPSFEPISPI